MLEKQRSVGLKAGEKGPRYRSWGKLALEFSDTPISAHPNEGLSVTDVGCLTSVFLGDLEYVWINNMKMWKNWRRREKMPFRVPPCRVGTWSLEADELAEGEESQECGVKVRPSLEKSHYWVVNKRKRNLPRVWRRGVERRSEVSGSKVWPTAQCSWSMQWAGLKHVHWTWNT